MDKLKIVKGNTFETVVEIRAYKYNGEEITDFDLNDCTNISIINHVSNGETYRIVNYEILDAKHIQMRWDRCVVGDYSLEVTGKLGDDYWRFYDKKPIFSIVNTNAEAHIPQNSIIREDCYQVDKQKVYIVCPKGDKGDTGSIGPRGPQGPKGDKGDKGDTGAVGPKGDKGDRGEQGLQGPQGIQGVQGPTGPQGAAFTYSDFTAAQLEALKGPQGETGKTGPQGPKGDKGDKGDQGIQGLQGEKGDKGDKGDTGPQGPVGPAGDASNLATVAITGDYDDLTNTPDLSVYLTSHQSLSSKQDVIDSSHKLSADLVDDTNSTNKFTNATEKQTWNGKQDALTFNSTPSSSNKVATMADIPAAFSGDYNDLSNKPTIPAAQVQSDWTASSGMGEILHKPTLATVATSGSYSDLSNTPNVVTYSGNIPLTISVVSQLPQQPDANTIYIVQ